jgi:hypothetical protein
VRIWTSAGAIDGRKPHRVRPPGRHAVHMSPEQAFRPARPEHHRPPLAGRGALRMPTASAVQGGTVLAVPQDRGRRCAAGDLAAHRRARPEGARQGPRAAVPDGRGLRRGDPRLPGLAGARDGPARAGRRRARPARGLSGPSARRLGGRRAARRGVHRAPHVVALAGRRGRAAARAHREGGSSSAAAPGGGPGRGAPRAARAEKRRHEPRAREVPRRSAAPPRHRRPLPQARPVLARARGPEGLREGDHGARLRAGAPAFMPRRSSASRSPSRRT